MLRFHLFLFKLFQFLMQCFSLLFVFSSSSSCCLLCSVPLWRSGCVCARGELRLALQPAQRGLHDWQVCGGSAKQLAHLLHSSVTPSFYRFLNCCWCIVGSLLL